MLHNMDKLNVHHVQGVHLIVPSKLLIFLTPSTDNSLQLFHSKHYLKLSDNSFQKVLMQYVELNTIRQLLPDSNTCCPITYSKIQNKQQEIL